MVDQPTINNSNEGNGSTRSNSIKKEKEIVYNTKWSGYLGIMLSSLVNFASVVDVSVDNIYEIKLREGYVIEALFGSVSFFVAFFILIFDRINVLQRKFDFKTVADGKLEGGFLLCLVIWWIVAASMMTRANGIAYKILNSYFSCWYTLGLSIRTLNQWSTAKDIISIHELTRLSKTLPYWYILFFASLIEMGSAADVFLHIGNVSIIGKIEYSISVGAISTVLAAISILAHYKLICCCKLKPGGIVEIVAGIILCIWWILAVAVLTTDQQIASSIQGVPPYPGSNLYLSLWLGLYGSVNICLQWKAKKAMTQMSKVTLQRTPEEGNIIQSSNNEEDDF
jgi:hypothetical protein